MTNLADMSEGFSDRENGTFPSMGTASQPQVWQKMHARPFYFDFGEICKRRNESMNGSTSLFFNHVNMKEWA